MTSKTYSASRMHDLGRVCLWQLRRGLPVSLAYWALFVLGTLVRLASPQETLIVLSACMAVYSFVMPAWLLSECFGRAQSDWIEAMPVSRGVRFWGSLLPTLASLWAPVVVALGLRPGITILYPMSNHTEWPTVAVLLILGAATLAFCFLITAASGTYLEYALNTGVLALLWPALLLSWNALASITLPWMPSLLGPNPNNPTMAGSPPLALVFLPTNQEGIGPLLVWMAGFALLLGAGAYWLYCHRKSENAGMPRRCRPIELLIRVGLALCAAAFVGYHMAEMAYYETWGGWGIPLTLGSMTLTLALVWAATEAFYRHSLKGLLRHWAPLAVSVGLTALGLGFISTGFGGTGDQPVDWEEVICAQVDGGQEFRTIITDGSPVTDRKTGPGEKNQQLQPGVTSPELLARVKELWSQWLQVERAAQYPYLPGRNAYPAQELGHLVLNEQVYRDLSWGSRPNPESQALFDQCQALIEEITRSDEYIDSVVPVNASQALSQVEQIQMEQSEDAWTDYHWPFETTDESPQNPIDLAELPKGFSEKVEAALREDLKAGRCSTYSWLTENQETIYRLRYEGRDGFTAKGGLLYQFSEQGNSVEPAAGKKLFMSRRDYYGAATVFTVTPEMPSTYALLEKAYQER